MTEVALPPVFSPGGTIRRATTEKPIPVGADIRSQGFFANSPEAAAVGTNQWANATPGDVQQYQAFLNDFARRKDASKGGFLDHFMEVVSDIGPLVAAPFAVGGLSGLAAGAPAAGWTVGAGETLGGGLGSAFGTAEGAGMFDFLSNVFGGVKDFLSTPFQGISDFVSGVFSPAATPAAGWTTGAGESLGGGLGSAFGMAETAPAGNFLSNVFSRAGTGLVNQFTNNPLGTISDIVSTVQGFGAANDVRAAGQDPLGAQRQGYSAQLAQLMANPNSVTELPGYQFGLDQGIEALRRSAAAGGYSASGNELIALNEFGNKYAGQFYNDQITRLAKLAGFDFSPVQLTAGQQQAEQQATELIARALGNIGAMTRAPFPAPR